MGVTELMLWVLEDNHDAQRAYQALGFEPTGERQFLPAFGQFERRLRLESVEPRTSRPTVAVAAPAKLGAIQVFSCRKSIASRVLPTLLTPLENLCHSSRSSRQASTKLNAIVRCNHVIKLILGRRKRNERGGEATVVPISFDRDR